MKRRDGRSRTEEGIRLKGSGIRRWRWTDSIYAALLGVLFAASTFMFYRQTIRYNGGYKADTSIYIRLAQKGRGLRLIKWIYYYLQELGGSTVLIAIYMGLVVTLTALANYAVLMHYLRKIRPVPQLAGSAGGITGDAASLRVYAQAASLIMFVTGSMYLPVVHARFYRASWCTYAWHSPTQQLMILFAMLSLLLFLRMYDNYMERIDPAAWIGLMITSTLSVWAKPSFMLVFTPTLIIVFLIELAVHAGDGKSLKRFGRLVLLGMSMFASGILILFLNSSIFGEGSANNVAVNIGGNQGFGYNIYAAAFCGLLFPAAVFVFNHRKLRELPYQIAIGMLVWGIAEWMVFHETGSRGEHGNFAWGRQFGCYYMFICALAMYIDNIRSREFLQDKKWLRILYLAGAGLALAAHVLSQTCHLYLMFRGHDYYI